MTAVIAVAYALGALLGLLASRHTRLAEMWPRIVRAQLLIATVALALVAVWRLESLDAFLWPALMIAGFAGILVMAQLMRRPGVSHGAGAMQAWAATSNISFWVTPVAAALMSSPAVVVAVLADRLGAPLWAVFIWLLRRDAPTPQRSITSWIDQAPLLAFLVGLGLREIGPPPNWTAVVPLVLAPVLAVSGAAVFVGSTRHPSQQLDPAPGVRTWASLVAVRIIIFAVLAVLAPDPATALVAILCGLSIPAFGPAQFSTVYGYREAAVAANTKYGWYIGAIGLILALVLVRTSL